jgi:crooked neck
VKDKKNNYDDWFEYMSLVESEGNIEIISEKYERQIQNVNKKKENKLCST